MNTSLDQQFLTHVKALQSGDLKAFEILGPVNTISLPLLRLKKLQSRREERGLVALN